MAKKQVRKDNTPKKLIIDREINDEDTWVIEIEEQKQRFIGGKTSLNELFNKSDRTIKGKVTMRFIKKSGRNVEKYV